MRITLSVATTSDGYLDDNSATRLMISTPEDWAAVQQLRATCDAILVGAETLRRDNPALLLRDDTMRMERRKRGLSPDLTRVVVTRSGALARDLRFFGEGEGERIVFSNTQQDHLKDVAEVIFSEDSITSRQIVTELEKRNIRHLLVEGGAQILQLFLNEGMADTIRVAVNPSIRLGKEQGRTPFVFTPENDVPCRKEVLGGMEVAIYTLHADTTRDDMYYLRMAIDASRQCTPCATAYRVGAVVVTRDGRCFSGYTHETSATHHAEQEAIAKATTAAADLKGGAIYASMEPCSKRASEPESCSQLIIRHGFSHVAFALYEPTCFVCCRGAMTLREAGIDVRFYPELGDEVRAINAHLKP